MLQSLEARAARERKWYQRYTKWRLSGNWPGFLLYLYWRNRYPVAQKVIVQLALLLEVYLLSRLLELPALTAIIFLLFLMGLSASSYLGVTQYFRVVIGRSLIRHEQFKATEWVKQLLQVSFAYALILAVVFLLATFYLTAELFLILFAAMWVVLLPLDLVTRASWAAVYTRRRLRRRLSIITFCRLLPSIGILGLSGMLDIYAYLLAVLIGRVVEGCYLYLIARNTLIDLGYYTHKWWKSSFSFRTKKGLNFGLLARYWSVNGLPEILLLWIAILLILRDQQFFLIYFILHHIVMLVSYPMVRFAQSMVMDLYLCVCRANSRLYSQYRIMIEKVVFFTLGLSVALLLVLVWGGANLTVYLRSEIFYELWLYLFVLTISMGLFSSQLSLHQAIADEIKFLSLWAGLFLGLGGPLFWWLSIYLRGNLPLVILGQSAVFMIGFFMLYRSRYCKESPFFAEATRHRLHSTPFLNPYLWVQKILIEKNHGRKHAYLLCDLDLEMLSDLRAGDIFGKIKAGLHDRVHILPVTRSIFVLAVSKEQVLLLQKMVAGHWSGYIRRVIELEDATDIAVKLFSVVKLLNRSRTVDSVRLKIIKDLYSYDKLAQPSISELINLIGRVPSSNFKDFSSAAGAYKHFVVQYLLDDSRYIDLLPESGSIKLSHLSFEQITALDRRLEFWSGDRFLFESKTSGLIVMSLAGKAVMALSGREISSDRRRILEVQGRLVSGLFFLRFLSELRVSEPLAEALFSSLDADGYNSNGYSPKSTKRLVASGEEVGS